MEIRSAYSVYHQLETGNQQSSRISQSNNQATNAQDEIYNGCSGCTMGVGQVAMGILMSITAVASEAWCLLCSGVCCTACGVGTFFSNIAKAIKGMFGSHQQPN
jgi:hypothetical protein